MVMRIWITLAAAVAVFAQTPETKTAEQAYKNIVALKGTPADQLIPAMQFIAAALGGECTMCHVAGKFDADDKPAKKTAREMIAMTMAINKNSFGGRTQVSCFTCHRGGEHPVNVPPVLDSDAAAHPEARPAGAQASPDDVIAKYIAAVGGADAMKKVTSRVMIGKIIVGKSENDIDFFTKAPNKRISITHNVGGGSITAFDGTVGWMGSASRAREMTGAESESAGIDAEFYFPLRIKEMFSQIRRGRSEDVGGVACDVLNATHTGGISVRLYFDPNTGLLARMARYTETPVGRNPVQIDYADYRDADGVKIPFRWTLARTNGRFTVQIDSVKSNVPIDDAKFAKPSGVAN
jgi:photosynthetic reaction center cytochrome c subunit